MYKYSIIIPSLNEEEFLPRVLTHLQKFNEEIEIILSDGGSTDNTVIIFEQFGVKLCVGNKGKGMQMNRAAKISNGEILIFLHADTFLPDDTFNLINKFFLTERIDIATFKMKFDSENLLIKIYSWFTKFDSIFTTFGDQVIVLRRSYFNKLGGIPNLLIFEDVEFFRKIRKTKTICKLPSFVITSARRFKKRGILKTQLLNGFYLLGYLVGINPDKIYRKYFKDTSFLKIIFLATLLFLSSNFITAQTADDQHQLFTQILQDYISNGLVKYKKLKDDRRLDKYIEKLENTDPNKIVNEKNHLAFWINTYNAYTLKFIVNEYPVESINDLHWGGLYLGSLLGTTIWDDENIVISGTELSLNNIEHDIIRKKFSEERIYFALVCASISCPPLSNEAYEGYKLEKQLNEQAELFFNDATKNKFDKETRTASLSKILSWYSEDFGENEQAILNYAAQFINKETAHDIKSNLSKWHIKYLSYNWDLNEYK